MIRIPQPKYDSGKPPISLEADLALSVDSTSPGPLETPRIRAGSPFAEGPLVNAGRTAARPTAGPFVDQGPMQYTAIGALISCLVVLGFAIPAAIWFPAGGVAITVLGLGLALLGVQSGRVKQALVLIGLQLAMFLYCVVASQS